MATLPKGEDQRPIATRIPVSVYDRLVALARAEDRSLAWMIKYACERLADELEQENAA